MTKVAGNSPTTAEIFDGVVRDLATCELWLLEARLGEPVQACAEFAGLLERAARAPLEPMVQFAIIERLRRRMLLALEEGGKRFVGRGVPLREYEGAAFDAVTELWTQYARVTRDLVAGVEMAARAGDLVKPANAEDLVTSLAGQRGRCGGCGDRRGRGTTSG